MAKAKRKILFIEKEFQIRFITKFCLLLILSSLAIVFLLYFMSSQTTTVAFENTRAVVKSTADFIFPILIQTVVIVTVLMAIFTIMLTLFISHKIAGPLYRFKKELGLIQDGDLSTDFRIREADQLQELAGALNSMKLKLRDVISTFKADVQNLKQAIAQLGSEESKKKALEDKLEEIKANLKYFKL